MARRMRATARSCASSLIASAIDEGIRGARVDARPVMGNLAVGMDRLQ
jgi:hypothetical protein